MVVSVAMAVYNGAAYLPAQLESLASQSRLPDELLICEDGSSDDSLKVLEEFSKTAPFTVKIIPNTHNKGYVATFSDALSHCRGDLVFLCDQDDFWMPKKIEQVCEIAESNPKKLLWMNNAELTDGDLVPSGISTFEQMNRAGQNPQELVLGCCMAIRKELLNLCLPIPSDYSAHDVWIHEFSELLHAKSLLPQILQYYRRHGGNESGHIVYRLEPISKWDYKLDYYKKLFLTRKASSLTQRISDARFRMEGLSKALGKADSLQKKLIQEAIFSSQIQVQLLEKRLTLIQMGFWKRVKKGISLWKSGEYSWQAGWKSLLKDILALH